MSTTDGGDTWQDSSNRLELPAFENGIADLGEVRFLDDDRGVILGRGRAEIAPGGFAFTTAGFVLRTIDAGQSWSPAEIFSETSLVRGAANAGGAFTSVCFAPDGVGLIAGWPPLLSRDGGATWVNIEDRFSPDVAWGAQTAPKGAACLDGRLLLATPTPTEVYLSTDDGETWELLSQPRDDGRTLLGAHLAFQDESSGWLTQSRLLHTTDGGATWSPVDNSVNSVIGSHSTVAISDTDVLSTSFSAVSVSHDGGVTWEVEVVIPFDASAPIFGLPHVAIAE